MIRLLVDGVECPLAKPQSSSTKSRVVLPRYDVSSMKSVEGWREGGRVVVEVEATPQVESLFGFASDMHRYENFNDSYHLGQIEADGVVVFEGVAQLLASKCSGARKLYRVAVHRGGAEWADNAAQRLLKESSIDASLCLTLSDIETSWVDSSPVRMLPLFYDSYPEPAPSGLSYAQQTLMPSNYHPFISVRAIVDSIAADSGYTLVSRFFDSDIGQKLMISGAYQSVDVTAAERAMGFRALRTKSNTAAAGVDGRVYAWEPLIASNVGAIVDTVSPNAVDEEGNQLLNAYSSGGCFTFEDGRPVFTPKRDISVAFDFHLRYTTDYRMVSSERLEGFDNIHLSNGCSVTVELQNPFRDKRREVIAGLLYNLVIFDFDPLLDYMLMGYGEITSRESKVSFEELSDGATELYVRTSENGAYTPYTGDWALYEGYISTSGRRDVEIDVRTPFERLTPTRPKVFNNIYFGGADEGQTFTLRSGCSITPIFSGAAGYGDAVTFADVANHNISQATLLSAIAHMFNLRVYTHRPSKQLFIEPYDDIYRDDVRDWRMRQTDEPMLCEETVADSFATTKLAYQKSEGATARLVNVSKEEFGTWTHHVASFAAKYSVDSRINELFLPTASCAALVGRAPSAEVLTVGDRDTIAEDDYVKPRIALYYGIVGLDDNEQWPSLSDTRGYPLVAFHSPKMGQTLCFEDRDGCHGLHRYYDKELDELATKQRLTCSLRLMPDEYIGLFDPNGEGASLFSLFRLEFEGESSLFRLYTIEEYDVENCTARCTFQRITTD